MNKKHILGLFGLLVMLPVVYVLAGGVGTGGSGLPSEMSAASQAESAQVSDASDKDNDDASQRQVLTESKMSEHADMAMESDVVLSKQVKDLPHQDAQNSEALDPDENNKTTKQNNEAKR